VSTDSPTIIFRHLLVNNLIANTTKNFVWFASTFLVFLETRSVFITSLIIGIAALTNVFGAVFFSSIIDHNRKKTAMLYSSYR